jgi:cellulose synthase (UDP-forming)
VLASLWGRVQPFRITPKHRPRSRGGIAPVLAAPLLVLLSLNGLNLLLIVRTLIRGGGTPAIWLGLLWGSLTLLGLLVALRACWDPPRNDPTPWLGIALPATLQASGPAGQPISLPVQITALSESGAALNGLAALPAGSRLQTLQLSEAHTGACLPPLPLSASATGATRVRWASGEPTALPALQALQRWLYGRPDAWPMRQAPPEWRALLALLANLLRPGPALQPDRLSLVPQQLAPDRCGPGNHSDRSPASAS